MKVRGDQQERSSGVIEEGVRKIGGEEGVMEGISGSQVKGVRKKV